MQCIVVTIHEGGESIATCRNTCWNGRLWSS